MIAAKDGIWLGGRKPCAGQAGPSAERADRRADIQASQRTKKQGYRECMTQMNTQVRTLIFLRLKPGLEQIRYAQGEKERG